MPRRSPPARDRRKKPSSEARKLGVLERRVARLVAAREAERMRCERRLAAARREADRQLATMVAEIAALRHHQARVEALERLVAERDATLAAQAERLARLEALLQSPTALG